MSTMSFSLLALALGVAAAAASSSPFDLKRVSNVDDMSMDAFEAELAAQLAQESADAALFKALAGARGRGRRDGDAPFRLCGTRLLTHIMQNNMCDVSKCASRRKRSAPAEDESAFAAPAAAAPFSRFRRGADMTTITNLCCTNTCRPSEIQEQCCLGAARG